MMLKIFYIFYLGVARLASAVGAEGPFGIDVAPTNGANPMPVISGAPCRFAVRGGELHQVGPGNIGNITHFGIAP